MTLTGNSVENQLEPLALGSHDARESANLARLLLDRPARSNTPSRHGKARSRAFRRLRVERAASLLVAGQDHAPADGRCRKARLGVFLESHTANEEDHREREDDQ